MRTIKGIFAFVVIFGISVPVYCVAAETKMPGMSEKKIETTPATRDVLVVEGELVKIDGEFYVVKHPTSGKQLRLHVDKETVFLADAKKPGDSIRAQVNINNGHALTIR